jgi:uncharacterized protein with von Willebrand factor type A (vWA) domain
VSSPQLSAAVPDSLFSLHQFDERFRALDLLPEVLLPAVITHPLGSVEERALAVCSVREALLQGRLPSTDLAWLKPAVQQVLVAQLDVSGVLTYCHNNPEVVDALLQDVLMALESVHNSFSVSRAALLIARERELIEQLKAELATNQKAKGATRKKRGQQGVVLSQTQRIELEAQTESDAWRAALEQAEGFIPAVWQERVGVWNELFSVLGDLQLVASLGFDFSSGLLQSHGWLNMVRLRELLSKLPQLQQVIQTLGRLRDAPDEPIIETIVETVKHRFQVQVEMPTPLVPMETKGVTRSDNISRMLPQEAALMGHPVLKKLWHAKRAEHALVSYRVEGVELQSETCEEATQIERQQAGRSRNKIQGPMVICLDTSGSMQGAPENIAKALVLECLSTAAKAKRGCYVYLFGSRDEIQELELSADEKGMDCLINFLCMSFGGGTDVEGPLQKALAKCKEQQWQNADILLVSDGEFSYQGDLIKKIQRCKKTHALNVQGLLIGTHSRAMKRICEPLHLVNTWIDLI